MTGRPFDVILYIKTKIKAVETHGLRHAPKERCIPMKHLQTLYAITTTTQLLFRLITIGWCALSDQVSMSIVVGAAAGALFYERNEAVMRGALRQVIRWDLLFLAVNLVVLITQTVLVHFALISYRTLGSLADRKSVV